MRDATVGLTLMGVRLYNQATGNFAATDPVPGGNATAYNYPTDPISIFDLTGRCGSTSTVMCREEAPGGTRSTIAMGGRASAAGSGQRSSGMSTKRGAAGSRKPNSPSAKGRSVDKHNHRSGRNLTRRHKRRRAFKKAANHQERSYRRAGEVCRYVLWNRKINDAVYGGNRKDREI